MCIQTPNSQTNSQVKTCKEYIDEKTLNSISSWMGLFYVLLTVMSVLVLFVFYKDVSNSHSIGYLFIFLFSLAAYVTIIHFYSHAEKVECKEIYDDLEGNIVCMYVSSVFAIVYLIISTCCPSDYSIKTVIPAILLAYTCCLGVQAKSYNNKYVLTKIDIDYMSKANKYIMINGREEESKLLVTKKSYLKYYKVMRMNYLIILAFLAFVASILGVDSIKLLQSIASH